MLWIEDKFEKEVVDALSSQLSVSHLLTKFLLARGITQSKEALFNLFKTDQVFNSYLQKHIH